uniref:Ig-like domain-containing protein n=1 Tax=Cyprinus carpio TaxID=7962 RepID=A0A8C2KIM7_CYPCA
MFDISSGNFSLLISNLTKEDEGLYSCWSNENQHKNFSLTVKGCTLSETEREPETKYTGDSVLLSCSCEDPNTKPEDFRWTHVESSGTEVSSETPRYKDRVHTFHKTTPSNLSLLISNLTEDDQGTYRCTVNHKTSADTRLIVKDPAVINALDYQYYLIFLVFLLCLMLLLAAGCIFWRFARAKKGSRGSQEIQRSNDEDEVTYSTVMQIKGKKPAEILQQDDVTYSSVTDIKGKKRPHKKEEGVVYSTVADMSRSTQDDVTYSSVVHIKSHKPKSRQNNAEEATIYAKSPGHTADASEMMDTQKKT